MDDFELLDGRVFDGRSHCGFGVSVHLGEVLMEVTTEELKQFGESLASSHQLARIAECSALASQALARSNHPVSLTREIPLTSRARRSREIGTYALWTMLSRRFLTAFWAVAVLGPFEPIARREASGCAPDTVNRKVGHQTEEQPKPSDGHSLDEETQVRSDHIDTVDPRGASARQRVTETERAGGKQLLLRPGSGP
jgi:hypothetical protein